MKVLVTGSAGFINGYVVAELLPVDDYTSLCPYKGTASYFAVEVNGRTEDVLAWTYPEPLASVSEIKDLVCFFDERVDVEVDGERRERPATPWSSAEAIRG